jgi:deoxyribonuclease V
VDVHYPPAGGACAALAVAQDTRFDQIVGEHVAWLDTVEAYQPGRFYLRELPAIQAVLATTNPLDLLIIDGYVDLDPHGRAGLGAHLYAEIKIPVIGVAKTAFRSATHAIAVQRGNATRPLRQCNRARRERLIGRHNSYPPHRIHTRPSRLARFRVPVTVVCILICTSPSAANRAAYSSAAMRVRFLVGNAARRAARNIDFADGYAARRLHATSVVVTGVAPRRVRQQ